MLVGQGIESIGVHLSHLEVELNVTSGTMPAWLPDHWRGFGVATVEGCGSRDGLHLLPLHTFVASRGLEIADVEVFGKD